MKHGFVCWCAVRQVAALQWSLCSGQGLREVLGSPGRTFLMLVSPEGSSFSAEETSHSKGSLIPKVKEVAHNALSQSVEDCFDSTLNYTLGV